MSWLESEEFKYLSPQKHMSSKGLRLFFGQRLMKKSEPSQMNQIDPII